MRALKSQARHPSWLNYTVLTVLLTSLFLVGLKLGTLVFAQPRQASPAMKAEDSSVGGALVNPPFLVHDVALTNQAGVPMSLSDLRGRAVLLFFGYTHCPDVCPTTLADFTQVKTALGPQANRVAFVFVTVDSQRDTPEVLKEFLDHFDPDFIGLTGDETILSRMAAEYGAYFSPPADQGKGDGNQHHDEDGIESEHYFVQHTSPSYLIDPKGFLRVVYFNGHPGEVIANGIRQILEDAG